jgi:hypothetical protein
MIPEESNNDLLERFKELLNDDKEFNTFKNKKYEDLMLEPKKLISCQHEIIFNVTANVMEENEKGETVRTKEICSKNYHIPVPPDQDYNLYMKTFFSFLEECLANSANNASEKKTNE